jgi:hypothetical protein
VKKVCCEQGDRAGEAGYGTDGRNTIHKLSMRKAEGQRLLEKHRQVWEDDIKTNLKGTAYECTAVIGLRIGIRSGLL